MSMMLAETIAFPSDILYLTSSLSRARSFPARLGSNFTSLRRISSIPPTFGSYNQVNSSEQLRERLDEWLCEQFGEERLGG